MHHSGNRIILMPQLLPWRSLQVLELRFAYLTFDNTQKIHEKEQEVQNFSSTQSYALQKSSES